MAKTTAKEVLTGSDVTLFLDGEELATFINFEATITINYEDVQIGFDVQRKATSWVGEGSLSNQATNSMGVKLYNKLKANKDAVFTIEAELRKGSTGESQFTSLPNCTLDSIPLAAWAKGELVENEIGFRFAPSEVQNTQFID